MDWIQIVILGVVQGITEFLPISSSGHLVVVGALFESWQDQPLPDVIEVNILLHAGTLAAILAFYWRQIARLLTHDRRVIWLLVVGTLPAVVVGLPLKYYCKPLLESPLLAGLLLPITGLLLIWSARRSEGELDYVNITARQALLVGLFQACALLPGLSRSGFTIVGSLLTGMRRESAATFAFLLAIPAIGGATVLEAKDLLAERTVSTPYSILALGMAVSFAVGLVSLWWLVRWLAGGKLYLFAYWCIPLGIGVVIWQLPRFLENIARESWF